jgi:hypothetical protein
MVSMASPTDVVSALISSTNVVLLLFRHLNERAEVFVARFELVIACELVFQLARALGELVGVVYVVPRNRARTLVLHA